MSIMEMGIVCLFCLCWFWTMCLVFNTVHCFDFFFSFTRFVRFLSFLHVVRMFWIIRRSKIGNIFGLNRWITQVIHPVNFEMNTFWPVSFRKQLVKSTLEEMFIVHTFFVTDSIWFDSFEWKIVCYSLLFYFFLRV